MDLGGSSRSERKPVGGLAVLKGRNSNVERRKFVIFRKFFLP
jgi:hypothetical protein